MNRTQQEELIALLGEDKALQVCLKFPNGKLPGKKFCKRILRRKIRRNPQGAELLMFMAEHGDAYRELFKRRAMKHTQPVVVVQPTPVPVRSSANLTKRRTRKT